MEKLTPITVQERLVVIDVIRGFALLGILLVNMQDFSSPWLYIEPSQLWNSSLDRYTDIFIDIFAQASFYTLFSFLFGFGMVIFKERSEAKGYSFLSLFSRRLFILLIFGVIHAFLIWHGDILISYALIGFILLLFHKTDANTMFKWAIALILIPSLLMGGLLLWQEFQYPSLFSGYNVEMVNQSLQVYSSGTYFEITKQRINDWYYVNNPLNYIFLVLILLPMFLLGAFFAKKRWFHEPNVYNRELRIVWLVSFSIAVIFKLLPYLGNGMEGLFYMQDSIGGPASAIFYATSIVLLFQKNWWRTKLISFSYVGRLSLSNYLLQSLIGTFIFYGYGLGFYGQLRPFYGVLLTIAIYILQIQLSKIWLRNYKIGPAEWLWRSLTYKSKQKIKIDKISRS